MTKKQIERLGFIADRRKHQYYFPQLEKSFFLPPSTTYEDIIMYAFQDGVKVGEVNGEIKMVHKFRQLLNIEQ